METQDQNDGGWEDQEHDGGECDQDGGEWDDQDGGEWDQDGEECGQDGGEWGAQGDEDLQGNFGESCDMQGGGSDEVRLWIHILELRTSRL